MPNVRGLVAAVLPDSGRVALIAIAMISIVILILAGLVFRRARRAGNLELGFSLALVATVLTSYHAFMYDLALLLWASLLVLSYVRDVASGSDAVSVWLTLGPVAVLFSTPVLMLLWLRMGRGNLLAPVLVVWLYGIAKEVFASKAARLKSEWASA
jgi:hypothetical protein